MSAAFSARWRPGSYAEAITLSVHGGLRSNVRGNLFTRPAVE